MKKTIVIMILAIYIASIAVVNFFGLTTKQFSKVSYVTDIQCQTITFIADNEKELYPQQWFGNTPLFVFDFIPAPEDSPYTTENLDTNPNKILLNYHVFPNLAENTDVKFVFDEDAGTVVYNKLAKTFVVLEGDVIFTIMIKATDGSNVSTEVKIYSRLPEAK